MPIFWRLPPFFLIGLFLIGKYGIIVAYYATIRSSGNSLPVCCLAGPKPQNVPAGSIKFSLPVIRTSICPFGQTGKHPGHVRNFYGIIMFANTGL